MATETRQIFDQIVAGRETAIAEDKYWCFDRADLIKWLEETQAEKRAALCQVDALSIEVRSQCRMIELYRSMLGLGD